MKITWLPDADEAHETMAYGRKWLANVPQDVDDKAGYEIEESFRSTAADGRAILATKKRRVSVIEMARQNPCFQVEGDTPKKRGRPPKPKPESIPNAAEEHGKSIEGRRMVDAEYAIDHGLTHEAQDA